MAIWPFGRRRKRPRKAADDDAFSSSLTAGDPLAQAHARGFGSHGSPQSNLHVHSHGSVPGSGNATRRDSKRRKRNNVPPATHDLYDSDTVRLTDIPPGTLSIASARFHRQPTSIDTSLSRNFVASSSHFHYAGTVSQTSLGHPPTLHGRRSSTEPAMLRRKSSKRKRNDYARELEIKNMTSHVTVLRRPSTVSPATQWWESNKRGARNIKSAHGAVSSQMSLQVDSGRSSPFDMEPCSFKISSFAALAPRPILRYAEPPRYGPESRDHSRASTGKERRQVIPAEDLTRISRIQDLADDMDASALRELMERDRRRKEMKRIADQQKLQRKLQRRADLQREQERRNPPVPSQLPTSGYSVGVGVGRPPIPEPRSADNVAVAIPDRVSSDTVEAVPSSGSWLRDPSKESLRGTTSSPKNKPLSSVNSGSALRGRSSVISHDISMSSMSRRHSIEPVHGAKGPDNAANSHALETTGRPTANILRDFELQKRHSNNAGKLSTSWTTFFRRGGTRFRRQNSERTKTPSEISSPPRDSFQRINQQAAQTQPVPLPERSYMRPGMFPRNQSKFTEHFTDPVNDFPPPPGRDFQSPSGPHLSFSVARSPAAAGADRSSVATPEQRAYSRSSGAGSPETNAESILLAHSLASIDSEGSWLSGRPSRRFSHPPKNSSSANSTRDILDVYAEYAEDDRDRTRHLTADDRDHGRRPPLLLEEMDQGEETFHAGVGKRALLVRPDYRPFSNNANIIIDDNLKNLYMETEGVGAGGAQSDAESASPVSALGADSEVRRATSVDLGKQHVRHISAGSAKLLEISRRASETRRLSAGSTGSGTLPNHA
ncbi:conserved hypothetical protein [Histoplasma capsulatum var. duboisii H88]|uniref:Uncharacterized protein n=2 Tax=Ajellomyces capsulatus TaxID=5037 RepID=F0UMX3_AJEC8|nr:conserved hypothetical protein [Histoplasma capsulatum H143]EGC47440.1 conserved hypothetical protein [Histoplasma capsulatum var. duboisii H88]QSS53615.1 hypothetical protein I7I53_00922 [Histoplasma capsulatum var. duboisii H88]